MAPYGNAYNATVASTAGSYLITVDGTATVSNNIFDFGTQGFDSNYPRTWGTCHEMFEYHYGKRFKTTDKKAIKNFLSSVKSKESICKLKKRVDVPILQYKEPYLYRNLRTQSSLKQIAYQKRKIYKKRLGLKF